MSFEIVDSSYGADSEGRNPKVYGYIEGYTSNTCSSDGEVYLRLNCKKLVDEETLDWFLRYYGDIPTKGVFKAGCRPLRPGDIIGEGIRLSKEEVRKLIKELSNWLEEE